MGKERVHQISSLVPGVMAQTGMETMEIIRGVIRETDPDAVIAIDALAARSVRRLNCTIQVTDTGINPGSGVCNHRCGLNEESLGIPVIGIGVPTVVDGATIRARCDCSPSGKSGRVGDGRIFTGTDHTAAAQHVCHTEGCG